MSETFSACAISSWLALVRTRSHPLVANYIASKIRIRAVPGEKLRRYVSDQNKAARNFDHSRVRSISAEDRERYLRREDVQLGIVIQPASAARGTTRAKGRVRLCRDPRDRPREGP